MNLRRFLIGIGFVAVGWGFWACTGGTQPVIIGGIGPSDGQPDEGTPPLAGSQVDPHVPPGGTNPKMSSAQATTTGTGSSSNVTTGGAGGATTTSTSTGGGCSTCAEVAAGTKPASNFCPGSDTIAAALLACACTAANCSSQCTGTCPSGATKPSTSCLQCAATKCSMQYSACAMDHP